MPKAKKKKVEDAGTSSNEGIELADESGSDSSADSAEPGPGPDSDSEPEPEPAPAHEPDRYEDTQKELDKRTELAIHKHKIINRRWKATIDTYFNEHAMLRWEARSVLNRGLERMQAIDDEQDRSEDHVMACDGEAKSYKKWSMWDRMARREPDNPWLAGTRDEAACELQQARDKHGVPQPRPNRKPEGGAIGLIAREMGLAEAFQWVHLSELRSDY